MLICVFNAFVCAQRFCLLSNIASRDVVPLFSRLAETVADDVAVLDEYAALIDPTDAVALRKAPRALARRAIRHWLVASGVGDGHPPSLAVVDRVVAVASQQAVRATLIEGWSVHRTKNRLRLERSS
jgi:TilS substrate binding domain